MIYYITYDYPRISTYLERLDGRPSYLHLITALGGKQFPIFIITITQIGVL